MLKKFWDLKSVILAFEVAFIFCFFVGIFHNRSAKQSNYSQVFNERSWYYINRGLTIPWSGVSLENKLVDFPIIKAPFLVIKDPWFGIKKFNKIIDLGIITPLFVTLFLISYIFVFFFRKAFDENKNLNKILISIIIVFIPISIFLYFVWFPRI